MSESQAQQASYHRSKLRKFFANPNVVLTVEGLKWLALLSALIFASLSLYHLAKSNLTRDQEERLALALISFDHLENSLLKEIDQIYESIKNLDESSLHKESKPDLNAFNLESIDSLSSLQLIRHSPTEDKLEYINLWSKTNSAVIGDWLSLSDHKEFIDVIRNNHSIELLSSLPIELSSKDQDGMLTVLMPFQEPEKLKTNNESNFRSTYILLKFDKRAQFLESSQLGSIRAFHLSLLSKEDQLSRPYFEIIRDESIKTAFELKENIEFLSHAYELRIKYQPTTSYSSRFLIYGLALLAILLLFITSEIFSKHNQKQKINNINKEISRQKRYIAVRERQLQLLTDLSPTGIMLCDKEGAQLVQNKTFNSILNITPHEGSNISWLNVINPEDRERVQLEWSAAIKSRSQREIFFRTISEHNPEITFLVNPIDFESQLVGYLVFAFHTTPLQVEAISKLEDIKREHDSSEISDDNLGVTDSYDDNLDQGLTIQTNTNHIQASSQETEPPEVDFSQNSDTFHDQLNNVENHQYTETSIVDILKEVIDLLHHKAKTKGIKLRVQISATAPTTLKLSPWLLKLSLIELIDSAIDRAEGGNIRILYSSKGDPARPYFSIKDCSSKSSLDELHNIGDLNSKKALPTLTREGVASFSVSELSPQGNQVSILLNKTSTEATPRLYDSYDKESAKKALVLERNSKIRLKVRELLRLSNIECCFANSDKEASLFLNRQAIDFVFVNADMSHDSLTNIISLCRNSGRKLPILSITDNQNKLSQENDEIRFISSNCSSQELEKILKES